MRAKISLYFLIVVLFIMGCGTLFAANKKYASPQDFLKKQKIIRVIANQYMGYGDLAAAMNVMNQLRSLGFDGTFEVVYNNKDAMIVLFNLPTSMPSVYDDVKNKNRFIDVSTFLSRTVNNQVEPVEFSVSSMAWSNACENIINNDLPNMALAEKMKDTPICTNSANFLNSKLFLQVDNWPFPVTASDGLYDNGYLLLNGSSDLTAIKANQTYFSTESATFAEAVNALEQTPQGKILAGKMPALTYLVEGIKNKNFNVMAIYGHQIRIYQDSNNPLSMAMRNLLTIISAARYAQLNGPADLKQKPLVIVSFYDYRKELASLNNIIKNNSFDDVKWSAEEVAQIRDVIFRLDLNKVIMTGSLMDESTIDLLKQSKPGQIFVLGVGGALPKAIFDGLFTYSGDNALPQIREGSSSASSLILTGRPHFRCGAVYSGNEGGHWEMSFDYLITDSHLKQELNDLYSESKNDFCWNNMSLSQTYPLLGNLIIQSRDTNSPFSVYFQKIKADAVTQKYNRTYQDLLEVIKVLNTK